MQMDPKLRTISTKTHELSLILSELKNLLKLHNRKLEMDFKRLDGLVSSDTSTKESVNFAKNLLKLLKDYQKMEV